MQIVTRTLIIMISATLAVNSLQATELWLIPEPASTQQNYSDVLSELLDRPGAQEALAWLAGRRQKNGRWRGSSPFRGRTWRELGGPEETSRWVTLQAHGLMAG